MKAAASVRLVDCQPSSVGSLNLELHNSMPAEDLLKELDRKAKVTAKCHFVASERFEAFDWVSLASVVTLSVSVIGLTLIDIFDMLTAEAKTLIAFAQVFSAVGVLGYSIFLSRGDFALYRYKHHHCGLEINALRDRISTAVGNSPTLDDVRRLTRSYERILGKYDNHQTIDFDLVKTQSKEYRDEYKVGLCVRIATFARSKCPYARHILLSLTGPAVIIWLLTSYRK